MGSEWRNRHSAHLLSTDPELMDFFTCYDQAERPVRGHDSSVRLATTAEAQKAIVADREFSPVLRISLSSPSRIKTASQNAASTSSNHLLSRPYTPPGRATRTSIAYDIQRDLVVFFKDSWRVACNEVMREGEVYAILNKAKVPNIPRCSASGDVGDDTYHSTSTNRFANASWAMKRTQEFTPHRHHRLILDDIGKKLETFRLQQGHGVCHSSRLIGAYLALLTSLESLTDHI